MPRHRSWVSARVWAEPLAIGGGVPDRIIVDLGGALETHLALRSRVDSGAHDPALVIHARGSRSTLSFDSHSERMQVLVSAGIEVR
jgi:hypothetical protein